MSTASLLFVVLGGFLCVLVLGPLFYQTQTRIADRVKWRLEHNMNANALMTVGLGLRWLGEPILVFFIARWAAHLLN